MENYQSFTYMDDRWLRVLLVEGELWFLASDVCMILGRSQRRPLPEGETKTISLPNTRHKLEDYLLLNETCLFSLILDMPRIKAQHFQNWLFKEVLPVARKMQPIVQTT